MITGATSTLGQALAHTFYQSGCKVVLTSRREHELDRIRAQLVASRPNNVPIYQPEVVALDLEDLQSLPAIAAHILDKCGQVDILVNNENTTARSDVLSSNVDVDVRVMNINYLGTVALTKGIYVKIFNKDFSISISFYSFYFFLFSILFFLAK